MRKAVAYIAVSVDGYIADEKGGVDWLVRHPEASKGDYGYEAFYETVDTIVMGYATYRQLTDELFSDAWPYPGRTCYVYSRAEREPEEHVAFTNRPPRELVADLRSSPGKDIWIMGGAKVIESFMAEGLIDEVILFMIPLVLGGGIPLFPASVLRTDLSLISARTVGNVVELRYAPVRPATA